MHFFFAHNALTDVMLDRSKFIMFRCPEFAEDLDTPRRRARTCKFAAGSLNSGLVSKILVYNGLRPTSDSDFSLMWASSPYVDDVLPVSIFQKLNHFPYSKRILGNKAELAYIIQHNLKARNIARFFPKTFMLPADRQLLYSEMKVNPNSSYIAKPPTGSCGHGIRLVTFSDFYMIPGDAVVSQYVSMPLCIDRFKFDMRIYVLVTSFAPLRAFVCREGLARFATESYSPVTTSVYSHLTNYTVNKRSRNWSSEFKWKLTDLLKEINHRFHKPPEEIMGQILDVVTKTLALVQHVMAPNERRAATDPFFEIYGFDVLLDRHFSTWLLEVNTFPSLGLDEDVDFEVKGPMVAQALTIAGIADATILELKEMQAKVDTADIELEAFERMLLQQEDERNEVSGNGFIRIFPSDAAEQYRSFLSVPSFIGMMRQKELVDPQRRAKELRPEQLADILVSYLLALQKRMDDEAPSRRIQAMIGHFLAAQGYQVSSRCLKAVLKTFIDRQRVKYQLAQRKDLWSEGAKERIMDSGDDFIIQLLLNGGLNVRNLRTLFY
jgi:hypothetical protein